MMLMVMSGSIFLSLMMLIAIIKRCASNPSRSPARLYTLTSTSGRFVAATTVTPTSSSIPSISVSKLVSTPACPVPSRAVASASISSCPSA